MISRLRECLAFAGCHMEAQVDRVNAFAGPGAQASRHASARSASPTPRRSIHSLSARIPIDQIAKMSTNAGALTLYARAAAPIEVGPPCSQHPYGAGRGSGNVHAPFKISGLGR